jgi:hypothetical protein
VHYFAQQNAPVGALLRPTKCACAQTKASPEFADPLKPGEDLAQARQARVLINSPKNAYAVINSSKNANALINSFKNAHALINSSKNAHALIN